MLGAKGAKWRNPHGAPAAGGKLNYGGGTGGVGVTIQPPKVYLVFWGSQWGTQSTNGSGYYTYSKDPKGLAPDEQAFFKGLGTNGELWDGIDTQYCQGVSSGATSCPSSNTQHVAYPASGALAGVWEDTSSAEPQTASGHQLGEEAVKAAAHFGNTTSASNRNVIYFINSPTGTNPDNYKSQGFCAWHDYTGDSSLSGGGVGSPYGPLAFANMPYVPDAGSGCGANFVNSPGPLDGVTIVGGHEYSEWMTDAFPAGGWTDASGAENGDKCAWLRSGVGRAQNITLGTGTFAVQGIWANDSGSGGGCDISHPIIRNPGGNTVTVTNPGSQTTTVGTAVSLQIQASDSGGAKLTYSATGLPAGLSISSSTGLISGTPTSANSYSPSVTASDGTGASGSTSFTWTVNSSGGGSGIVNGGFETGSLSGWTTGGNGHAESVTTTGPHTGKYAALLGSTSPTNGYSSISQTFKVPSGKRTLTLWYNVSCRGKVSTDWATAALKDNTAGTTIHPLRRTCVSSSGWKSVKATVMPGHSYTLTLTNHDNNAAGTPTYTRYDDVGLS
jgi:serine protease